MADKFHNMGQQEGETWVSFHCPGCEGGHAVPVTGPRKWTWNGSLDKPSLTPSLSVNAGGSNPTQPICHTSITDGKIQFLSDCTHKLAGQTIELPDWND